MKLQIPNFKRRTPNDELGNWSLGAGHSLELGRLELGASAGLGRRRGFTFIEVMFAVMILAFGVIMIAAMLPVALRETQRTRDTNAGSAILEGGFHTEEMAWATSTTAQRTAVPTAGVSKMPDTAGFPVTFPSYGWNYTYTGFTTWGALQQYHTLGNRVDSVDGTYAYIPFYSRAGSTAPQIALIAVGVRNVESMRSDQASISPGTTPAGENPFLVPGAFFGYPATNDEFIVSDNCPLLVDVEFDFNATVSSDGSGVDKIEPDRVTLGVPDIDSAAEPLPGDHEERIVSAAVKGAALVLVNDNGDLRILRLGERIDTDGDGEPEPNVYQLAPGGDTQVTLPAGMAAGDPIVMDGTNPAGSEDFQEFNDKDSATAPVIYRGYLVGRMVENPGMLWDAEDNPYVGPTQVVQVLEGRTLP